MKSGKHSLSLTGQIFVFHLFQSVNLCSHMLELLDCVLGFKNISRVHGSVVLYSVTAFIESMVQFLKESTNSFFKYAFKLKKNYFLMSSYVS